ncbi:hypothetical protein E4N70_05640 [Treponema vincentii]|uniref:hypothetical protein n=1 Tax=Treponema vincentii TaxID=69710 RepID=UPI0020A2EEE1|nr:hypothetical protein [Treponema vincentii]UTC61037.1 hypothetical protein E4N70_05640 [Treponema vincentii]
MRKLKKSFLAVVMICLTSVPLFAHDFSFGVKLFGLTIHPIGALNYPLFPLKLDSEGFVVFNPGVTLNAEYFVWRDIISIKAVQGLYGDCVMQFAGFSHIGFRIRFLKIKRFSMNVGIGPTFLYKRSWYRLPGYNDSLEAYKGTKDEDWQYLFYWYAGEIETNIQVNDNFDVSITVIPGVPDIINISTGFRYNYHGKES